jgi:hypothetical protein
VHRGWVLSVGWWIGGFGVSDQKQMHLLSQVQQLYGDNIMLERKADKLQQELDHYRMAAEAEAKRGDELAARVEGLERTMGHCIALPESRSDEIDGVMREALKESTGSSLILHDADLMITLSNTFNDMGAEPHVYGKDLTYAELGDYFEAQSDKLRKQAAEQESKS